MRWFLKWQMGPTREAAGGDGSDGGGGGFDPVRFKAEIMADVTKSLNGGLSRIERQLAGLKTPAPAPPKADGDDDGGDPAPDPKGAQADPKLKALERQIAKLNESLEGERKARTETEKAASEKERQALIRSELAKAGLADHAVDDAFRYFRDEIRRSDSGELVAGADETPFGEFIAKTVQAKPHWLPAKAVNGTGANPGTPGRGGKAFDMDGIKPGMSSEEKAAALSAINSVLASKR